MPDIKNGINIKKHPSFGFKIINHGVEALKEPFAPISTIDHCAANFKVFKVFYHSFVLMHNAISNSN